MGGFTGIGTQLQRLTGRRVLNGGVTGYGFDQVVLRAEYLVVQHNPSAALVSFIADDIARTEMRRMWWHDEPWFAIEGDALVLKGVPVPPRLWRLPQGSLERILVWLPPVLQYAARYKVRIHRVGAGEQIALRLVERLAKLQANDGIRIVLMAQYPPHVWQKTRHAGEQRRQTLALLQHATAHGLATLDTFQRMAAEPRPQDFYGRAHLTARGNQMIASLLAATLPNLLGGRDST